VGYFPGVYFICGSPGYELDLIQQRASGTPVSAALQGHKVPCDLSAALPSQGTL